MLGSYCRSPKFGTQSSRTAHSDATEIHCYFVYFVSEFESTSALGSDNLHTNASNKKSKHTYVLDLKDRNREGSGSGSGSDNLPAADVVRLLALSLF